MSIEKSMTNLLTRQAQKEDRLWDILTQQHGAEFLRRDDSHGETKRGWWLDGVYLGRDMQTALEAIRG